MQPKELHDRKRFFLTIVVVTCSVTWLVMPLTGIFVADPMIQLLLSNAQVGAGLARAGPAGLFY
jgi:hypothetical protein